jgi:hypothetical protein
MIPNVTTETKRIILALWESPGLGVWVGVFLVCNTKNTPTPSAYHGKSQRAIILEIAHKLVLILKGK